jgi:RHS repeat-associated protein
LDENANIISYEEYHPFGTTSYRSGHTETETSQKRYKNVGKERDEETGLYYYGFRYYAAWLCRFISVDPLQFEYPHYTPFQYAGNKPITYIDLDGLEEAKPNEQTGSLPWYLQKSTNGGKPVLTLGLHNFKPSKAEDSIYVDGYPLYNSGVFIENTVKSVWNAFVDSWNGTFDGNVNNDTNPIEGIFNTADAIGDMTWADAKMLATDINTYENLGGALLSAFLTKKIPAKKFHLGGNKKSVINGKNQSRYLTNIEDKVTKTTQVDLDSWIAESFTDGNYRTVKSNENLILYRTFGGNADAGGGFATTMPAANRIQAKIDGALLPEWGNSRMYEAMIEVPKGEVLNIGKVAEQFTKTGTKLAGQSDQVLLPKDWDLNWIKDIRVVPSK